MLYPSFTIGAPVRFITSHDILPCNVIVPAGTTGIIVSRNDDCIYVLPSTHFPTLSEWGGCIELEISNDMAPVRNVIEVTGPVDIEHLAKVLGQMALNAAALAIQNVLHVGTGDLAGIHFSDDVALGMMEDYARTEILDKVEGA